MDNPNQLFKPFVDETPLRILNRVAQRERCIKNCLCEIDSLKRDLARDRRCRRS